MSGGKLRVPLFILLARVAQFALGFSNRVFYFVLVVGLVVMIIVVGLTHSDEIPSEETAEKIVDKFKEKNKHEINIPKDENGKLMGSGHKPPKGIQ